MKKVINQDFICSLIFMTIGILFYKGSLTLGEEMGNSGAEYFPKMIATGIIFLSAIYLIKALKDGKKINYFKCENSVNRSAFFKVIGVFTVFTIAWPYVPFIVLSSIYLIVLGVIFKANLIKSIIFSISTSVIIYLVFSRVFHVMLN